MSLKSRNRFFLGFAGIAVILWAYWSTILATAERWRTDPQYSHGWLVPFFSAYLLYRRRQVLLSQELPQRWWGLALIIFGIAIRVVSFWLFQPWLDTFSLLLCLFGLAAAMGGRKGLRAALPAILFLGFMIPLPYRFQQTLGGSLQTVATKASTYILQTLGVPAIAEGNIILLSEERIGVFEACNGLSMLVTFFALAVGFALVIDRHWLYSVVLVLAAIPIAVGANVIRIAVTGLLYESGRVEGAKVFFHDVAGWAMMPLGAFLLMALLKVMDRSVRLVPTSD